LLLCWMTLMSMLSEKMLLLLWLQLELLAQLPSLFSPPLKLLLLLLLGGAMLVASLGLLTVWVGLDGISGFAEAAVVASASDMLMSGGRGEGREASSAVTCEVARNLARTAARRRRGGEAVGRQWSA